MDIIKTQIFLYYYLLNNELNKEKKDSGENNHKSPIHIISNILLVATYFLYTYDNLLSIRYCFLTFHSYLRLS